MHPWTDRSQCGVELAPLTAKETERAVFGTQGEGRKERKKEWRKEGRKERKKERRKEGRKEGRRDGNGCEGENLGKSTGWVGGWGSSCRPLEMWELVRWGRWMVEEHVLKHLWFWEWWVWFAMGKSCWKKRGFGIGAWGGGAGGGGGMAWHSLDMSAAKFGRRNGMLKRRRVEERAFWMMYYPATTVCKYFLGGLDGKSIAGQLGASTFSRAHFIYFAVNWLSRFAARLCRILTHGWTM